MVWEEIQNNVGWLLMLFQLWMVVMLKRLPQKNWKTFFFLNLKTFVLLFPLMLDVLIIHFDSDLMIIKIVFNSPWYCVSCPH